MRKKKNVYRAENYRFDIFILSHAEMKKELQKYK